MIPSKDVTSELVAHALRQTNFTKALISHYGKGYSRSIDYDPLTRTYVVMDHGERVRTTAYAPWAVDAFNAIRPREV